MKKSIVISWLLLFTLFLNNANARLVDVPKVDFCPLESLAPKEIKIKNATEEYQDPSRNIKDFGTDFVVKEFFSNPKELYAFLSLVYKSLEEAIGDYTRKNNIDQNAAFLIFKGGNVLRMIANQFFTLLNPDLREMLKAEYAQYFKRSDADFSIIVDDHKLNGLDYDKVIGELVDLTYKTLANVRNEMQMNPYKYFNFFQLKPEIANDILQKHFAELQKIEALKDENNEEWYNVKFAQLQLLDNAANPELKCDYLGQIDYSYDYDPNSKNLIIGKNLSNKPNWIVNTVNKTLEWPSGLNPDNYISFILNRLKAMFKYVVLLPNGKVESKSIGAELVDVSFPLRKDFRLRNLLDNYNKLIEKYILIFEPTNEQLEIKSESIVGLTEDLHEIIFNSFLRPWLGAKYEKRVNRTFFLSIVEAMTTFGSGSKELTKYTDDIEEKILQPLSMLYPLGDNSAALADDLKTASNQIAAEWKQMENLNHFWSALADLANDLVKNPLDNDQEQINNLLQLIRNNLQVMRKMETMQPMIIDKNSLKEINMRSLF